MSMVHDPAFGRAMAKLAAEQEPSVNRQMLKQLAANVLVGGAGLFGGLMAGGLAGAGVKRFAPKSMSPKVRGLIMAASAGLGAAGGMAMAAGMSRARQLENVAARKGLKGRD